MVLAGLLVTLSLTRLTSRTSLVIRTGTSYGRRTEAVLRALKPRDGGARCGVVDEVGEPWLGAGGRGRRRPAGGRRRTPSPEADDTPDYSPDGRFITFTSERDGAKIPGEQVRAPDIFVTVATQLTTKCPASTEVPTGVRSMGTTTPPVDGQRWRVSSTVMTRTRARPRHRKAISKQQTFSDSTNVVATGMVRDRGPACEARRVRWAKADRGRALWATCLWGMPRFPPGTGWRGAEVSKPHIASCGVRRAPDTAAGHSPFQGTRPARGGSFRRPYLSSHHSRRGLGDKPFETPHPGTRPRHSRPAGLG
jgi:hypothetical protein